MISEALEHLTSEDIEVFHSVLRGATRYQDSQAQIARKALMITSRPTSPIAVLKRWSELKKAVQEDEVTRQNQSVLGRPIEVRFSEAVESMRDHLSGLFSTLSTNAGSFSVRGAEESSKQVKRLEVFYYLEVPSVEMIISPVRKRPSNPASSSGQRKKTKGEARTDLENSNGDDGCTVVRLSERLLPPQLYRRTKLHLNKHVDIGQFQSRPVPPPPPKRTRTRAKLLETEVPKKSSKNTRACLDTGALDAINLLRCGCRSNCTCKELLEYVCYSELSWFVRNVLRDDRYSTQYFMVVYFNRQRSCFSPCSSS